MWPPSFFMNWRTKKIYIKSDTVFNESFARVVEEIGVGRFFSDSPSTITRYTAERLKRDRILSWIGETRQQLHAIYESDLDPVQKRKAKENELQRLKRRYFKAYGAVLEADNWHHLFSRPINNATLAAYSTYNDYVTGLQQLLRLNDGNFVEFYQSVLELTELSNEQRRYRLSQHLSVN